MILLVVLGLAAAAYAVYSRVSQDPPGNVQTTGAVLKSAYSDLCRTRSLAASDAGEARALFYAKVHSPLHDIARRAQAANRSVAARMLEAKNDVEQAFNASAAAAEIGAGLDLLLASTEEALISIGVTTSSCVSP
ncbi:hypothetical protein BH23ACT12_BH23ACT12_14000 [soil metagenome]